MPTAPPNLLLIMTDQQRGDALGIEDHPVLQTPQLDYFAAAGTRFRHAYSACPVCIPARRTLMTGQRPATQGTVCNHPTHLDAPTLPEQLHRGGYQTALCGKLHFYPFYKRYGFEHFAWSDGPFCRMEDDYQRFLRNKGVTLPDTSDAHGQGPNAYPVTPWHLDDELHFSNWCVTEAIEFLERRDPSRPFFLNVSFLNPHQPYTPPRFYLDRYLRLIDDIPEPYVGDWARQYDQPQRGTNPQGTWRLSFDPRVMKEVRAGYYACINHIDDQISRLMNRVPPNTLIVFTSDHGEMLGDHQWLRKRLPYEPSARVPMLVYPHWLGDDSLVSNPSGAVPAGNVRDEPVELMDIMPTLLDAAGLDIPDTVEGQSLLPLLKQDAGDDVPWRDYVHGECSQVPTTDSGMQYLTDGKRKYIWWPALATEQYFNLADDPREMHDLANDPACAEEIKVWRARLVQELDGRPEGFVRNGELVQLEGFTPNYMPGYERADSARV